MPDIGLDRFSLIFIFAALALAPFALMVVSSYVKIVVVLSLIRNALGVQQIPPNTVLNALSIILSMFIMAPVGQEIYDILSKEDINYQEASGMSEAFMKGHVPFKDFMMKHSGKVERVFFVRTSRVLWPPERLNPLSEESLLVLIPAFTITELTSAFKIGFLLYLPFLIIDLIVSNVLLAMGMMMVSPMTISLPFKLLLFVLVNGWSTLIHGLVLTYKT